MNKLSYAQSFDNHLLAILCLTSRGQSSANSWQQIMTENSVLARDKFVSFYLLPPCSANSPVSHYSSFNPSIYLFLIFAFPFALYLSIISLLFSLPPSLSPLLCPLFSNSLFHSHSSISLSILLYFPLTHPVFRSLIFTSVYFFSRAHSSSVFLPFPSPPLVPLVLFAFSFRCLYNSRTCSVFELSSALFLSSQILVALRFYPLSQFLHISPTACALCLMISLFVFALPRAVTYLFLLVSPSLCLVPCGMR